MRSDGPLFRQAAVIAATVLATAAAGLSTAQVAERVDGSPADAPPFEDEYLIPESLRGPFAERLMQLGDDSWRRRSEAAAWLREVNVSDQVFQFLTEAEYLNAEQKHQLVAILRDRILTRRGGALGIQMRPARLEEGPGIVVVMLMARMPAENTLKVGDRITHVNGQALRSFNTTTEFTDLVSMRQPGETVRLRVERPVADRGVPGDGAAGGDVGNVGGAAGRVLTETIEVDVPLAEDTSLGQETVLARQADRERRAREAVMIFTPRAAALRAPAAPSAVDSDPAIIELKSLLARPERTQEVYDRIVELRNQVRNGLTELGLSVQERQHRYEVYERFMALLSQPERR